MKTLIIICICFFASFITNVQVTNEQESIIYKTYDDYINKVGEHSGKYKGYWPGSGTFSQDTYIEFEKLDKKGKKGKAVCSKIWGFSYGGELFKIYFYNDGMTKYYYPAHLIFEGKNICYYENAHYYLESKSKPANELGKYFSGATCYVSADLNSDLLAISCLDDAATDSYKIRVNKFQKKYPKLSSFLKCAELDPCSPSFKIDKVGECIKEFENKK